MRNYILRYIVFVFIIIINTNICLQLHAQISEKGTPISFTTPVAELSKVPIVTMPNFDVKILLQEDSIMNTSLYKSERFAKPFKVDIDLKTQGLKEIIKEIGTIWRLRIKSEGAFSLNIIFSDFKLPQKAKLFLYSADKQFVIGAFTYVNNKEFKSLATTPVKGDEVIIELFEPNQIEFESHAIIGQVSHDYKNYFKGWGYGQSGDCQVNVNCPAGAPWQDEKKSVCRYIIDGTYYNSGVLVNNTSFDGTPYILTAAHCFVQYEGWTAKKHCS